MKQHLVFKMGNHRLNSANASPSTGFRPASFRGSKTGPHLLQDTLFCLLGVFKMRDPKKLPRKSEVYFFRSKTLLDLFGHLEVCSYLGLCITPPPQAFQQAKALQCMGGAVAAPPPPSAGMDQLGQHATGHVKSVLAKTALLIGDLVVSEKKVEHLEEISWETKQNRWEKNLEPLHFSFFAVEHQTMCQGHCFLAVGI